MNCRGGGNSKSGSEGKGKDKGAARSEDRDAGGAGRVRRCLVVWSANRSCTPWIQRAESGALALQLKIAHPTTHLSTRTRVCKRNGVEGQDRKNLNAGEFGEEPLPACLAFENTEYVYWALLVVSCG